MISLANVKSPFKAVAEYPPTLPYVGQDNAYHRLQDFTQAMRAEEMAHFLSLFGDWAIGKSRLAHELVAQFCGQSSGWTLTTGEHAELLLRPLTEDGDVVPLFVSFVDALNFQQFGIDTGTAMGKLTCAAAVYLADASRARSSHYHLLQALRAALTNVNVNFDFDRIAALATDTSRSFTERADQIVAALSAMTGGRARRILVIVDEVESASESNPFADEMEKEVNNRPIPARAVRDLYVAVKDATNTNAYPSLNFIFFNTLVSKRLAHMEALERRMLTADLEKATSTDLDRLLEALRQIGYPLHGMLEDLARRAFFAADRNFGWFSFIMSKAHYILVENPELGVGQVFAEVCKRTGKVFQPSIFEARDINPPELKDAMRHIIYNQIPATLSDLGLNAALRANMLKYQDPFQTRFIGEAAIVAVSADMLTRGLLDTGLYASDQQPLLTGEGSVRFDPAKVLESLRTFAWKDRSAAAQTNAHLWIYADAADFENQVSFAYAGFGSDLSAGTVRTMHKLLMERQHGASNAQLVAPTMALLRRFNDLWGKAAASNWLPEAEWERVISTIDRTPEQNDMRLLQGMANVLFDSPQIQTSPPPYPDISAPSLTLKLESYDLFNVTSRNQFVLLKARETAKHVVDDLRAIKQRVPVLLVFSQSHQLETWERYIRESHEEHLAIAVTTHVVEPQTREWEFYVRYALRDAQNGFKASDATGKGKELRTEFRDVLHDRFKQWLGKAEQQGYVLRPFYPAKNASSPAFRDFVRSWAALLRAGSVAALGLEMSSVLKGLEDYERERSADTLQLIEGEEQSRRAMIPAVLPHILDVLRTQPRKMTELADEVFSVRSSRAVSFPTTNSAVMEQLLALMQEIGVVEIDAQSRYVVRTVASFNAKFDQAFQRLGAVEGTRSGYVEQIEVLSEPVQALAMQLDVNEHQLALLKSEKLLPEKERLAQLPLDRLAAVPPDQSAYSQVARRIGAIATALDEVLGKAGQSATPPPIDPRTLQGNIDHIAADKGYREFSIEYRANFLQQVEEHLSRTEQDLRATLSDLRASFSRSQMDGVATFPTRPLLVLLEAVQADLDATQPGSSLPQQLRQQPQDAPLKVLKGAGRLSDVLLKLAWYKGQLDEQNPDGWRTRYAATRAQWTTTNAEFARVDQEWQKLQRYFDGTVSEHVIMFTGAELIADMQDLADAVASFSETSNASNVSMDELMHEIEAIRERCSSVDERIRAARTNAEAEITMKLDESDVAAVSRLAKRLGKEHILPNRQRVLDARSHRDAHTAVERYLQDVLKTGQSLCERPELYEVYLQVYHDVKAGKTSDQIFQRYGEATLRTMSERKLVTLRYTVDL